MEIIPESWRDLTLARQAKRKPGKIQLGPLNRYIGINIFSIQVEYLF